MVMEGRRMDLLSCGYPGAVRFNSVPATVVNLIS
jgi:hypothetical protein